MIYKNGRATPANAFRTRIESPTNEPSAVDEIDKIESTRRTRDSVEDRLKAANPASSSAINGKTTHEYDSDNSIGDPGNTNRDSNVISRSRRTTCVESDARIGEMILDISETLDNRRGGTTAGRFERSLGKKSDYVGAGEQVPRSERLYRHPKLSYEERRKQIDEERLAGGANPNFNGAVNKRVPELQSSTKSKVEIETPLSESRRRAYVPVLPGCNDTASSHAGDANRAVRNRPKNDNVENGDGARSEKRVKLKHDAATANGTHKKEQRENKGYINIRDLQKNERSTTSPDIPVYDPNKIPYVDVPDYSDIREESLDEQDRRANKSGMKGKEDGFADPEVPADFRESSKSVIDDESSEENTTERASNASKQKSGEEKIRVGGNLNGKIPDKPFDYSNIGTPEKSKKDESSSSPKQRTDVKGNSSTLRSEPRESGIPSDFPNASKYSNGYEFKETGEDERPKGSRQSLNSRNDSNNADVGDEKSAENSGEEDGRVSLVDTVGMQGERNSGGRAGPIIFDINEYRKPFDLDEFLKDDPIMKKLTPLEKETPAKYGGNGKRVSSDFNESESVNAFKEPHVRDDGTGKGDSFDDLSKSRQPADFTDVFAKVARYSRGERRGTNKSVHGPKSTEKSDREEIDEDSSAEERASSRSDDVDEFHSKRFTDDVTRSLQLRDKVKEDRGRTDSERKEDTYDALPAILSKKTRVPRPDEDTGRRIKATDVPSIGYKNFWSLEYKSPIRRVDMEAQERRK